MASPPKRTSVRIRLSAKKVVVNRPSKPRPQPVELVSDVWQAMVNVVQGRREHMAKQAAKFELTLPQAHLLRLLEFGPARTMASLAEALACDASNVTGIVDRLEARGLIHRGSAEHDRRVKTIVVSAEGAAVIRELSTKMFAPPAALSRLTSKQLTAFRGMITRAFGVPKKARVANH